MAHLLSVHPKEYPPQKELIGHYTLLCAGIEQLCVWPCNLRLVYHTQVFSIR